MDSYESVWLSNPDNCFMCSHCPFNKGVHDAREILEPCGEDHCLVDEYEHNTIEKTVVAN